KIQRQIERYKAKHRRTRGDGADRARAARALDDEVEMPAETDTQPKIVRRKNFQITPMTEAEAIEQMSFSQHESFFIFYNADTAKVNVLYLRKDGNFGLIEPEIA